MTDLVVFKEAGVDDFEKLWQIVTESWKGQKTRVTRSTLREDLFGKRELKNRDEFFSKEDEAFIEIDLNQAQLPVPFCRAILASIGNELVGYLLFHQAYSPWKRRLAFVDYIYVRADKRKMGKFAIEHRICRCSAAPLDVQLT
jgi:hypothetical protein